MTTLHERISASSEIVAGSKLRSDLLNHPPGN